LWLNRDPLASEFDQERISMRWICEENRTQSDGGSLRRSDRVLYGIEHLSQNLCMPLAARQDRFPESGSRLGREGRVDATLCDFTFAHCDPQISPSLLEARLAPEHPTEYCEPFLGIFFEFF
jgi:hypothetical protein